MRKLLTATAIATAVASTAHAATFDELKALDCNKIHFTNAGRQADCGVVQTLIKLYNDGKVTDNVKVKYDGNGFVDAVIFNDEGDMLVPNAMSWAAKPGSPMAFIRRATPAGQLPACDSREVVEILARITHRTLAAVYNPTRMGSNNGRNICSVSLLRLGGRSYTVEWLDQVQGRYWVQITGRL